MAGADAADGMVDLFGLLAYAELVAFLRLSSDAALAPSLEDKAALGGMAVAEFGHFRVLHGELGRMGAVPEQAMQPFVEPLDEFHARTAPSDWLESLVKAYVGDGIAADFYRAVAELLDPQARALVMEVLADTGHAGFVISRVRAAVEADPAVAGGSPCGPGGWWVRRWPRHTGWWRSGPRWPCCSWARSASGSRAGRARSAGCSRGSPTPMTSAWRHSAWPRGRPSDGS